MDDNRPIHDVSFVSIDLECTGPVPGFDHITEFGAARFTLRRDGVIEPGPTFSQLVQAPRRIPSNVASLTGIDDKMVADAPSLADVWPDWLSYLNSDPNTVIIAHSARVDLSFLVLSAVSLNAAWTPPTVLCTSRLAKKTLPDAGKYGLHALVDYLECSGMDPVYHRALPDALHARNVFARCVFGAGYGDLGALRYTKVSVPDLHEFDVEIPERLGWLAEAAEEGQAMPIVYRGGSKGRGARLITPLGFYQRGDHLFMRAFCHLDKLAKSFRCDRIVSRAEAPAPRR